MSKIVLDDVISGYGLSKINENFQKVQDALNNEVLYRDNPEGEPNTIEQDVDVNGFSLYNVDKINGVTVDTLTESVDVVVANIADINTIADNIDNVNVVANIDSDITAVSGIANDVSTLAPYAPDVAAYTSGIYAAFASSDSGKGAELVEYQSGTVETALDARLSEIENYAALDAYTGDVTAFYVRGFANTFDGGHGVFRRTTDTPSSANGIYRQDALGRWWKREYTGWIYPEWFGASGSGGDDYAGIQAAIDYAESIGGGVIKLSAKDYTVSNVLLIDSPGVSLIGEGFQVGYTPNDWLGVSATKGSTKIIADHNLGAAVRIKTNDTTLEEMTITSTSARMAGSAGTAKEPCAGVFIAGPDLAGGLGFCQRNKMRNVCVSYHPNHGVLGSGDCAYTQLEMVHVNFCKGHGFVFDRRILTNRVNSIELGLINMWYCRSHDNEGHMLAIGHPDDINLPAYRVRVVSLEGFRNGSVPAKLYAPYSIFAFGENIHFENCAPGGLDATGAPAIGGIWIGGRENKLINNRYILVTQPVYVGVGNLFNAGTTGGLSTRGIEIDGMVLSGSTPFSNAVEVHNKAQGVKVKLYADQRDTSVTYTNPVSKNAVGYWSEDLDNIEVDSNFIAKNFSSSQVITLDDDTVAELTFSGPTSGIISIASQVSQSNASIVSFRVGSSAGCVLMATAGETSVGSGPLTNGTSDGVDTDINVYAHTDNKLYIKNRRGGQITLRFTINNLVTQRLTAVTNL